MVKSERLTLLGLFYLVSEYIIQRIVRLFKGRPNHQEENIQGKTVVITGANCGLGFCTAMEMARRGATVVLACRNQVEGQKALEDIKKQTKSERLVLMELDLADLSSVRKFAQEIKANYPQINILINNAGVYTTRKEVEYTKDGFELHFGVNHLGHFLLTNLLLSNLRNASNSRVVTISSSFMMLEELDIDDLNLREGGNESVYAYMKSGMVYKPYNNSKFANALFSAQLGKILEGSGVSTYALCPGMVGTDVFRYLPWYRKLLANISLQFVGLTPQQGVETILYCALSKDCQEETGQFYRFSKLYRVANKKVSDEWELCQRLWEESTKMVGLKVHHY